MLSLKWILETRETTPPVWCSVCLVPALTGCIYTGGAFPENASWGKTQGEPLPRLSSQVKAMCGMTSCSKAEGKDLESTKWSQARSGRLDETQEKRVVVLPVKRRWLRTRLQNTPNDLNVLLQWKGWLFNFISGGRAGEMGNVGCFLVCSEPPVRASLDQWQQSNSTKHVESLNPPVHFIFSLLKQLSSRFLDFSKGVMIWRFTVFFCRPPPQERKSTEMV